MLGSVISTPILAEFCWWSSYGLPRYCNLPPSCWKCFPDV